jgi:hypothetical protein
VSNLVVTKYCVVLSNVCVLFHCGILLSLVYRLCHNQYYIELIYLFLDLPYFILFYYFNGCGCGTYTLIHIDHLDIRQIREVEHRNFIGIYLSLRKCKTPMYKLILNYAHMYASCSSRGRHAAHYIVLLFHFGVFYGFGIFTWNQLRL